MWIKIPIPDFQSSGVLVHSIILPFIHQTFEGLPTVLIDIFKIVKFWISYHCPLLHRYFQPPKWREEWVRVMHRWEQLHRSLRPVLTSSLPTSSLHTSIWLAAILAWEERKGKKRQQYKEKVLPGALSLLRMDSGDKWGSGSSQASTPSTTKAGSLQEVSKHFVSLHLPVILYPSLA